MLISILTFQEKIFKNNLLLHVLNADPLELNLISWTQKSLVCRSRGSHTAKQHRYNDAYTHTRPSVH